jgi:GNAT superfamily N-acetyltransferase
MRSQRLASLDELQELYLERRVALGSAWLLEWDGGPAGYAVVDDQGILLELFHEDALATDLTSLIRTLAGAAGVTGGLFQSFDPTMTALAATARARVEPVGVLFRKILDPHHRARSDVAMRPAAPVDVRAIAMIDDGFFADDEEIRRYLDIGGLSVLEDAANRIVGCGVAEPVIPGCNAIDIGMLVAPAFRRQGYGAFIVSHLKSDVLSKGLRPICGCAIDNVGSWHAIQNAGFAPDHRLLRFKL